MLLKKVHHPIILTSHLPFLSYVRQLLLRLGWSLQPYYAENHHIISDVNLYEHYFSYHIDNDLSV